MLQIDFKDPRYYLSATFFTQVFFFGLSTFFFLRIVGNQWQDIIVLKKFNSQKIGLTLLLVILTLFLLPFLLWLNEPLAQFLPESLLVEEARMIKDQENIVLQSNPVQFIFTLITLAITPAICEELAYRGFILKKMIASGISQNGAIVMSALIFSLSHMQPLRIIPIFVMGLGLGYVSEKFGSIKYSMLLHALINGVQLSIAYFWGMDAY